MSKLHDEMRREASQYQWVKDICIQMGMTSFAWKLCDFGLKFVCEFGIPDRNIYTGLVLRKDGCRLKETRRTHKKIRKALVKILKANP